MRGLFDRYKFPARPGKLALQHPVLRSNAGRLAAISRADGSMFDLLTNKSRNWTAGAAGKNSSIGPVAYPTGVGTGGITWPAIIPSEVVPNLTMAVIWQHVLALHGQGVVTIAPNAVTQITIATSGNVNWAQQGVGAFNNMPQLVPGHTYFFVASQISIVAKPRTIGTLLDMTTGQIWIAKDPGVNYTAQTTGASYTTLTYTGGTADSNLVAAAMIAADWISQEQQLAWADDPWGFWFDRGATSIVTLAGHKPIATGANSLSFALTVPPIVANFGINAFHFPSNPTVGPPPTTVTGPNGHVYVWDGVKWTSLGGTYVPLAGGTMTGALLLYANPSAPLMASTQQYTDAGDTATLAAVNNGFLKLTGGTLTGNLSIANAGGPSVLNLSGPNGGGIFGQKSGSSRWQTVFNLNAEAGSNSGSDCQISAYADDGATVVANPLTIKRSTGVVTLTNLSAPQAIGSNRIINGNFWVNQRAYVSATALAAAAYAHDRWKAGASGCTYSFTAVLPDTTITITAGTLTQVIEAGMIEGGVYTLAWTGTAQARVYQGTPTGAYAASPITTAALTAGTNAIVEFNTGTLTRVKFEIGSVATLFNRQSLARGTIDCQRYYQKFGGAVPGDLQVMGHTAATGNGVRYTFSIQAMRAAPSVSMGGAAMSVTNVQAVNFTASPTTLQVAVSGAAAGVIYWHNDVNLPAGFIIMDAEL